jgi:hypothetical protein
MHLIINKISNFNVDLSKLINNVVTCRINSKTMNISACGIRCDVCEFFNKSCTGCIHVKGSPFWAKEMVPGGVCPLYDCSVNSRGYKSCGECSELPCQMFLEMKDPNSTDEEHKKSIEIRVLRLRSN